jgi:hypothetical protein
MEEFPVPPSPSWTKIYGLCQLSDLSEEDRVQCEEEACHSKFSFNFRFGSYLRKLEKEAIIIQYQLACLSTLGGAYHLCNKPQVALEISLRQEMIGRKLGSTLLIVRAKVFQAVNLRLLGRRRESDAVFRWCYILLDANPWLEDSKSFVDASKLWIENNAQAKT